MQGCGPPGTEFDTLGRSHFFILLCVNFKLVFTTFYFYLSRFLDWYFYLVEYNIFYLKLVHMPTNLNQYLHSMTVYIYLSVLHVSRIVR